MVPCLQELYVLTNADGKLVFGDADSSRRSLQDYVLKMQTDADVQALVKDVNGLLDTAMEKGHCVTCSLRRGPEEQSELRQYDDRRR